MITGCYGPPGGLRPEVRSDVRRKIFKLSAGEDVSLVSRTDLLKGNFYRLISLSLPMVLSPNFIQELFLKRRAHVPSFNLIPQTQKSARNGALLVVEM